MIMQRGNIFNKLELRISIILIAKTVQKHAEIVGSVQVKMISDHEDDLFVTHWSLGTFESQRHRTEGILKLTATALILKNLFRWQSNTVQANHVRVHLENVSVRSNKKEFCFRFHGHWEIELVGQNFCNRFYYTYIYIYYIFFACWHVARRRKN